ncbi:hypothetical protein [Rhodococcus koreensis]|uniref:Rv1733c family protein n=1 Tax=Rhodococcus koreensis TaxID=99653 RepID=UPI001F125678|nr:hypothetical protein [Rhodococcus koreensis]
MRRGEPAPVPVAKADPVVAAAPVEPQPPDAPKRPLRGHPHPARCGVVLLLIPVAAAFGSATHTRLEQQAQALRARVDHVPAVLLEDTYLAPDSPEYTIRPAGSRSTARACWATPHGERVGAVPTDMPAKAGQTVTIDVDADGNLTGPVPDSRENTVLALTAACGVWALAAGAVLLSTALARRLFTRNRLRRWAQEWNQFDIPPREPR